MAIMKKTVDLQKMEKLVLKRKRRRNKSKYNRKYSYGRLSFWLEELKSRGYFFEREWLGDEEQCMEFGHFLTKKKLFLHLKRTAYTNKPGKGLTIFVDETPALSKEGETEWPMLHFEVVLARCGMILREKMLHRIPDTALRENEQDSLLTVLAKNHYRQKRVGRIQKVTADETKTYWAGEFLDEKAQNGEACYFYLVQIQRQVKECFGTVCYMVSPEWYVMKSKEPVREISLSDGVIINLAELEWLNKPFADYADVPETLLRVRESPWERWDLTRENMNRVLAKLQEEGFRFRRERTFLTIPDCCALTEEQTWAIGNEAGLKEEYAQRGINRIETEFVNWDTKERKLLIVEPDEIRLNISNGSSFVGGMYTVWFRMDQACTLLYYGEEEEQDWKGGGTEIVFPEPVYLTLLEQHQLITPEQIKICHIMACKELRDWFFDFDSWFPCVAREENYQEPETSESSNSEIGDEEKKKAGRVRRVARGLRYELVDKFTYDSRVEIEVYGNRDRTAAIFLMEDGGVYRAKYVDGCMDVKQALKIHLT